MCFRILSTKNASQIYHKVLRKEFNRGFLSEPVTFELMNLFALSAFSGLALPAKIEQFGSEDAGSAPSLS